MDSGDLPFFLARTFSAISHAMAQPRCPTWYLDDHLTVRGEVRKWYLQLLVSCWTYLELKLDGIGWLKINEHNSNLQLGAELTPHPNKVFPHFCVQYQDDEGHLGPTFRFHMYICIYLHGWNLYFIINKVILLYLSLLTTIPVTSQWGRHHFHLYIYIYMYICIYIYIYIYVCMCVSGGLSDLCTTPATWSAVLNL